jgi:gluconolactonase
MKSKIILTMTLGVCSAMIALSQAPAAQAPAQGQRQGPGVQGPNDPRYAALIATCKNPPPARGGGGGGGGQARGAAPAQGAPAGAPQARGGAPAAPAAPVEYTVTEIPGVIAAGQRWKTVWETQGNNADGIVGLDDGSVLIAQNDNSAVVKLDKDGKVTTAYSDTNTGGALSMNSKNALFVASRALNAAIIQLTPQRKILANTYQGDPLDCIGGVLNDVTADSKGGVYFTMGGVYYANPKGEVMGRFGTVGGNGIILSPDEKTLYVTGRLANAAPPASATGNGGLVAFDVEADGSLTNERQIAWVGGDGSAVDKEGRIYTTGGGVVSVVSPKGDVLGQIPTPRNLISVTFGGTDKKLLYGIAIRDVQIFSIPTIAPGLKGRPK